VTLPSCLSCKHSVEHLLGGGGGSSTSTCCGAWKQLASRGQRVPDARRYLTPLSPPPSRSTKKILCRGSPATKLRRWERGLSADLRSPKVVLARARTMVPRRRHGDVIPRRWGRAGGRQWRRSMSSLAARIGAKGGRMGAVAGDGPLTAGCQTWCSCGGGRGNIGRRSVATVAEVEGKR
jgi:hypothetical protein